MDAMRRRMHLAALAAACGGLPGAVLGQQPRVYRFSPVNQYGIELTAKYWNPIIELVSRRSGVRLELKIGRTSADTTAYALANEVEFLFSNHLFNPERERLGWRVFGRRSTPHRSMAANGRSPVPSTSATLTSFVSCPASGSFRLMWSAVWLGSCPRRRLID